MSWRRTMLACFRPLSRDAAQTHTRVNKETWRLIDDLNKKLLLHLLWWPWTGRPPPSSYGSPSEPPAARLSSTEEETHVLNESHHCMIRFIRDHWPADAFEHWGKRPFTQFLQTEVRLSCSELQTCFLSTEYTWYTACYMAGIIHCMLHSRTATCHIIIKHQLRHRKCNWSYDMFHMMSLYDHIDRSYMTHVECHIYVYIMSYHTVCDIMYVTCCGICHNICDRSRHRSQNFLHICSHISVIMWFFKWTFFDFLYILSLFILIVFLLCLCLSLPRWTRPPRSLPSVGHCCCVLSEHGAVGPAECGTSETGTCSGISQAGPDPAGTQTHREQEIKSRKPPQHTL